MKKPHFPVLLAVTALFAVFTLGFFLGRNQNHDTVQVSVPSPIHVSPTQAAESQTEENSISAYPININTASVLDFMTLPDIGLVIAQRIVDYRNANGAFETVEELMNVEGIGEKRMEQLLDLVTIGG